MILLLIKMSFHHNLVVSVPRGRRPQIDSVNRIVKRPSRSWNSRHRGIVCRRRCALPPFGWLHRRHCSLLLGQGNTGREPLDEVITFLPQKP